MTRRIRIYGTHDVSGEQSGIVYQKDLGPETAAVPSKYAAYDPDDAWRPSRSP